MTALASRYHHLGKLYRKELRSFVDGATFYIASIIFLLLVEYLFFRNAFINGEDSLRTLFDFVPWLFLLLLPAVTMGSMSREQSDGTLEFVLTHPVTDGELVFAKFLAALSYVAVALVLFLPIAIMFAAHGSLDWGALLCQYLASIGVAAVFASLGIFVSSLFRSQVSALLVTVVACFLLLLAGSSFISQSLPLSLSPWLSELSTLTHFQSMERGVIDTRDVWYFVTAVLVFLSLAYLQLSRRRFGNRKSVYRRHRLGAILLIVIAVLTNVVGARIPGRLDLTRHHLYTLSSATKSIVGNLNDVVTITLYASDQLPAQLQPVLRDIKDTLSDYKTIGHGNIEVKYKNPKSQKDQQAAQADGVQQVQFNTESSQELKVKQGYLGIALSYGGQHQAIPFVQQTGDLEYQLTSLISQLTVAKKPKVAFLAGAGEKDPSQDMQSFDKELQKQFDVSTATPSAKSPGIPSGTNVLVIAGPTKALDATTQQAVTSYLNHGGSVLAMLDGAAVNTQQGGLTANANAKGTTDFLSDWGVKANNDLVYDVRSNQTLGFSSGQQQFFLPYPYWPQAEVSKSSQITRSLQNVVVPWGSSISTDSSKLSAKHLVAQTLVQTTSSGGISSGPQFNLSPQQQFNTQNLDSRTLGVAISGAKGHTKGAPRLVVLGSSQMFGDNTLQQSQANLVFGLQAMAWLGQQASLGSIEAKSAVVSNLKVTSGGTKNLIEYLSMALAFLIPAVLGALRFWRRRSLAGRVYVPQSSNARSKKQVAA